MARAAGECLSFSWSYTSPFSFHGGQLPWVRPRGAARSRRFTRRSFRSRQTQTTRKIRLQRCELRLLRLTKNSLFQLAWKVEGATKYFAEAMLVWCASTGRLGATRNLCLELSWAWSQSAIGSRLQFLPEITAIIFSISLQGCLAFKKANESALVLRFGPTPTTFNTTTQPQHS